MKRSNEQVQRRPRWLALLVAAIVAIGMVAAVASPASARTVLCTSPNYGYDCVAFSGYSGQSIWGYPVDNRGHNCTNYAAYRLAQNGAANPGNLGNAYQWDDYARSKGFTVDGNSAVGSIAQWDANAGPAGSSGHVAYVEIVTTEYIEVTDDNWGGTTSRARYYRGQSDWPSHFIHIKDVLTSSGTGSLLQVENTGSGWSAYNITQTTGINIKGKPGVLWGANGPNVFAAGSDGALRQFTICPGGTGWCSYVILSPGALGGAGVSVAHTGSAIEVFATTQDGTLLQVENTGSGWHVYNISQAAGGVRIKGAPAVLWDSSGGPNVFAVDTNGAMRRFKLCPGGGGWCTYVLTAANMFAGGVDAIKNGSNFELFARSTGNHLYQVEFANGGWSVYDVTNFSGNVQVMGTPGLLWTSSGPSVYVADTAGRLRQFVICSSGTSWCTYEILQSGALGSGAGVDVVHTGSAIEVFAGSKG